MNPQKTLFHLRLLKLALLFLGTIVFAASYHRSTLFDPACIFVFAGFWFETALFFLLSQRFPEKNFLIWTELFLDLLLINGLVYFTGGRESPFIFLYPLLIFVASFHLGRRGADIFTLAALVFYSFIYWKPPRPSILSAESIIQFFVPLGAMGLLGLMALKLTEEIHKTREKYQRTSRALFQAEELHRHILRSLASGLIITDLDFKIVSANQVAQKIFSQDLKGKRLDHLVPNLDPQRRYQRAELCLKQNGREKYIGYSLFPLRDEKGNIFGFGFIFQDITEFKEQERRLRQAEHLAALGTMASGLVHEIKNPLASICGAVEFLKESKLVAEEGKALLEILARESTRLDKLVSDFLLFARPGKGIPEKVNLKNLLEEIEEELSLQNKEFSLRLALPQGLCLLADKDRLKQIFLNLIQNALEAGEGRVKIKIWANPEKGEIFIKDNAGGIPAEIQERIFEPFFTTKPQGTGLGLAVVYSLVKNWGGTVKVQSKGKETIFTLWFPEDKILLEV